VRGSVRRSDDGAISVIFAVTFIGLIGFMAMAIDMGAVYVARRELNQATDAAALAAAQEVALGSPGCPVVALDYLNSNASGATMVDCQHDALEFDDDNPYDNDRQVSVIASNVVPLTFAGVFGHSTSTVTSTSEAEFGPLKASTGLRPFGLCSESAGFQAWQASDHSTTQIFRINYTKDSPSDCGTTTPGNWGLIDFNGGANSNAELSAWVQGGYPGEVIVPNWYQGDTGAFSNPLNIGNIVGQQIFLPVFDQVTGGGGNADFHLNGIVAVKITDFKANGAQSQRYLEIQFQTAVVSGGCCDDDDGAMLNTGLLGVRLCRFDDAGHCD
jgi:hypothetical protein